MRRWSVSNPDAPLNPAEMQERVSYRYPENAPERGGDVCVLNSQSCENGKRTFSVLYTFRFI